MSARISLRPNYVGRLAWLTVSGVALAGSIAVLTTARAARIEPEAARLASTPVEPPDAEPHLDPTWMIAADPVQRIGYRHGRLHVFEVVPLGPTAIEVEVRTAAAFLAMRTAAADAGVELRLQSGFRTVEEQRALFRAWRSGRGNKAAAPGRSNHQSGRALDIAVAANPGALAWLQAHAASFGFKRTVKSEPWHWEYMDSAIARGATKRKPMKVGHARRPARRPGTASHSSARR